MWIAPTPENQDSLEAKTWDCSNQATVHSIASQIEIITGERIDLSVRFLAIMSGTIPGVGNYLAKVFETIKTYGIPLNADCPRLEGNWTLADYYGFDITPELLAKAKKFLDKWDISYRVSLPPTPETLKLLNTAPLIAWVPKDTPNHFVEVLDPKTEFDSYGPPFVKPLVPVQNFSQIIIKPKNMSNAIFYHKVGTQEFGFALPATTPESIKDKALNLGREDILKPDGSVDFTKAKEVTIL